MFGRFFTREKTTALTCAAVTGLLSAGAAGLATYFTIYSAANVDNCDYIYNNIGSFNGCALTSATISHFNCPNLTDAYRFGDGETGHSWVFPHGWVDVICNSSTFVTDVYNAASLHTQASYRLIESVAYPLVIGGTFAIGALIGWTQATNSLRARGVLNQPLVADEAPSCMARLKNRYRLWRNPQAPELVINDLNTVDNNHIRINI